LNDGFVPVDAAGTKTVLCGLGWSWRSWRDIERYFLCSGGIVVAQDVHCLIRATLRKGSIGDDDDVVIEVESLRTFEL
jgi:hypothetical protein